MTGILPVKKYGTHSALNMFEEFSMTEPRQYAEYVGFTEEEVRELCSKYQVDFELIKDWYDGYSFTNVPHVYNPRSVVTSVLSGNTGSYWTRTETYEALKVYLDMNYDGLKDSVIHMIGGDEVQIDTGTFQNDMTTFQSKDDILTLLVHLGYLAFDFEKKTVSIPNAEVREAFVHAIAQIKDRRYTEKLKEYGDNLLLVGINYDDKKQHECIIEKFNTDNKM